MVSFYMKFSIDKSITGGSILVKTKGICLLIILISLFVFSGGKGFALSPTADCRGTLKAYVNDVHLNCKWYGGNNSVICGRGASQYTCRCAASNRAPV